MRARLPLLCLLLSFSACAGAQDQLEAVFKSPPHAALPHTWWHWVNGNVTKEGITADIEAMKRVGIGGAQIFNVDVGIPAGKAPFMSARWRELINHAIREANRLGIEICVHNCAGWSSSGGPWNTPQHAMQVLTASETTVHGPVHFAEVLKKPASRSGWYRDIAVLAFRAPSGSLRIANLQAKACYQRGDRILPDTSPTPAGEAIERGGIVDLTAKLDTRGGLTWDVPEGDWIIQRIGHTTTGAVNAPAPPEGRGLEVDKLSKEALDAHWAGMFATVLKEAGPRAGKTFNNVLIDSYEVGSQNWTPKFREEFRRRRGYDLLPFLPVAATGRVLDSVEVSERFLWDFRRTICDLFDENYYGYFGTLCRKNGLKFSTEAYGNGAFDNITSGGLADIPMAEFWVGGGAMETTKLAASSGHIYGRNVIGAESFTADDQRGRWLVDPYSIKALGDLAFCNGINRYIFHRYAAQPWTKLQPGMTMGPWGIHFERTETWWYPGAAWLKYCARCQSLLQSGRFVADILYYTGQEGPNDLPYRQGLNPAPPKGYDYDGCDWPMLALAHVVGSRIVLPSGMSYRVLVLPDSRFMAPAVAQRVAELVKQGATVVGPKPAQSPSLSNYPACDARVKQIANEVWGGVDGRGVKAHRYGEGQVIWGRPLADVLKELRTPPDFEYQGAADTRLTYIHRRLPINQVEDLGTRSDDGYDLYFVSNQRYRSELVDCTFRASGQPELWNAATGAIMPAPVWRAAGGRTTVQLPLDPAGSVFVVFRKAAPRNHLLSLAVAGKSAPREPGPWIEIVSAHYEPQDGRAGGADVSAKVRQLVADGQFEIAATNDNFGDPTPLVVKRLRIEYTLNGKQITKTVGENETLELAPSSVDTRPSPFDFAGSPGGRAAVRLWENGDYTLKTARGRRTVKLTGSNATPITGAWTLHFPPGLGAPDAVTLPKLASWTEQSDAGVRYFSGTAEYTKEFTVGKLEAAKVYALDLGRVKNLAHVWLNGRDLGELWKAPFHVDVTGVLRPGQNTLRVQVTNLWPNRLIGDEQLPPDVEYAQGGNIAKWPDWLLQNKPRPTRRVTFSTWRFFTKDTPLLESGLIGPVVLRTGTVIELR